MADQWALGQEDVALGQDFTQDVNHAEAELVYVSPPVESFTAEVPATLPLQTKTIISSGTLFATGYQEEQDFSFQQSTTAQFSSAEDEDEFLQYPDQGSALEYPNEVVASENDLVAFPDRIPSPQIDPRLLSLFDEPSMEDSNGKRLLF